jgi:hypothetical protein
MSSSGGALNLLIGFLTGSGSSSEDPRPMFIALDNRKLWT